MAKQPRLESPAASPEPNAVWDRGELDPVVCIFLSCETTVHEVLALPASPITQGNDTTESVEKLKEWVVKIFNNELKGDHKAQNGEGGSASDCGTASQASTLVTALESV